MMEKNDNLLFFYYEETNCAVKAFVIIHVYEEQCIYNSCILISVLNCFFSFSQLPHIKVTASQCQSLFLPQWALCANVNTTHRGLFKNILLITNSVEVIAEDFTYSNVMSVYLLLVSKQMCEVIVKQVTMNPESLM